VRLEEGVEGLIHISELAEGNFASAQCVRENDPVRVKVLNVDVTSTAGLVLRQAHAALSAADMDVQAEHDAVFVPMPQSELYG
jgi:predicted RNA-binding protein with RPS1 domain